MKNFIFSLILFLPLLFTNCSKDEETEPDSISLSKLNVVEISETFEWDYWVFGRKDYYFIKENTSGTKPKAALYHSSAVNKDFIIYFNDEGFVDKVVFEGHIFVFRNFNGNMVDMGVIFPNKEVQVFRGLETPNYNWETMLSNKSSDIKNQDLKSELIRWTGHAIAGIPCALSAAAAVPSGGISLVTAGITCGIFLARLTGDIAVTDFNIENGLDEMFMNGSNPIDVGGTVLDCALNGLYTAGCISGIIYDGYYLYNDYSEYIDTTASQVLQLLTGALDHGYGDVQITLTWDNGADLDLWVIDPNNEEIYWNNKNVASGGTLDVDDVNGHGPENIFWPQDEAPDGTYKIYVHHYPSSPAVSNYTVLINAFGFLPRKYKGIIENDQFVHIVNISPNGWKSAFSKDEKMELNRPLHRK